MTQESPDLFLIHVEHGARLGPVKASRGDVEFPAEVRGWSEVLDCRVRPYTDKSLDELLHFGNHVHKVYLLVYEGQLLSETLVSEQPLVEPAEEG